MAGADVWDTLAGRKGFCGLVRSGVSRKILFCSFFSGMRICAILYRASFLFPEWAGPDIGMFLS